MVPLALMGLYALQSSGALASIFGKKQRKTVDPQWLSQHFGAQAVNSQLSELFNRAINSVQGQQLMTSAARSGQQFETDEAKRAGAAGLGPSGGATGGADIFAGAAAGSAGSALQTQMKSGLMQSMLPVANQMVQDQLGAYMQSMGYQTWSPYQPSSMSDLGSFAQQMGTQGVANYGNSPASLPNTQVPPGTTTDPGGTTGESPGGGLPEAYSKAARPAGQAAAAQPASSASDAVGVGGGQPSMQTVQGQIAMAQPSRFNSKISRLSGRPTGMVQAAT